VFLHVVMSYLHVFCLCVCFLFCVLVRRRRPVSKRRRRLMFYDAFCVFVFFFFFIFWRDRWATAGRIFTKSLPADVFAVLFANDRTWWKSAALENWGPKTSFGVKILTLPSSNGRCAETRRNSGKAKTSGVTIISSLPSHLSLVKLVSGEFEL